MAAGHGDHDLGVEGLHQGVAVAGDADDDVAGQQQADLAFGVQGAVGELGLQAPRMM